MAAMILNGPPQSGQVLISMPNTLARSSAQRFARFGRSGVVLGGLA